MQPRVSAASVALALAVMAAGVPDANLVAQARPMHAAIVHVYDRYLEEKEAVSDELEEWLNKYGPKGPKNGWIPVTESRSELDALEEQLQRFFLTKQEIQEAREANPNAIFGTDGPFTLMTMDEFKSYLKNEHVNEGQSSTPQPTSKTNKTETLTNRSSKKDPPSTNGSSTVIVGKLSDNSTDSGDDSRATDSGDSTKNVDGEKKKKKQKNKTWAPATEGPLVVPAVRRRRLQGTYDKSQYSYDSANNYQSDGERGFASSQDSYTQNQQGDTGNNNNGDGNNKAWDFGAVSSGDSNQVATVSGGSSNGYTTSNTTWGWWSSNNQWWGGNITWGWNWGSGSTTAPSTPSAGSSDQWSSGSNLRWPGSSNSQWSNTPAPASGGANQEPATQAPWTQAPVTQAPWTEPPTTAPATAPPTVAPIPVTKAPTTKARRTKAPATEAPATAAPAIEKSTKSTSDSTSARDSDSVDWSTSKCVNPPGLQGQCGSCWAFATVGAVEAVQCITNGDKSAATYSEQQLVSCDTKDFGCNGGAPVYAMQHIIDNGICTESSYPYSSVDGGTAASCSNTCTPTKPGVKSIARLEAGDESALVKALQKQPIIASVASDNSMWKQYMGGVISSCSTTTVDHAILVVGYDSTSLKIKNSWGTDWGEDGYVRITRSSQGMGTCEVLTDMSYPEM